MIDERKRPSRPAGEWSTKRCEKCGEQVEVSRHGLRTLCSCDAAK
ncbi:hypothetical protein ACPCSP_25615 [Streptomyces cinereoruber]